MKPTGCFIVALIFILITCIAHTTFAQQRNIVFCGEVIPVDRNFVATKLMNVIRSQIPNANLPSLRQKAVQYFPFIISYLRKAGLPEDFKYLPIVESGFTLATSRVGARGFWQLMPKTAMAHGLIVSTTLDERDDIIKSTIAACIELINNYNAIQQKYQVSSWVLTAAAYNFGIGNVFKVIQKQGTDYFSMSLNPETAAYVYKLIALKELFEYPELYMKGFGYNVFSTITPPKTAALADTSAFASMMVKVTAKPVEEKSNAVFVAAHIKGKYKDFKDGDLVSIELGEDLIVQGGFSRKGSIIKGAGWVIENRIYVDLGYGHDVLLYDINGVKGIAVSSLDKDEPVLLKNEIYDENAQWK